MSIPTTSKGLLLNHDGFSGTQEGPSIADLAEFVTLGVFDMPKPDAGQVLVKVILANINPSDLHFIKGEYGQPRRSGVAGGFEGVGMVVAAGEGGEHLINKRVAFYVAANGSGSWAEYALTDAASCLPLSDDIRDEDGACFFINPLSAMAMFDGIQNSGSDAFVLSAAGSQLGKLLISLAKLNGKQAIALVRNSGQVEALKALGAAEVLVTSEPDFQSGFSKVSRHYKPKIFLDCVADQNSATTFDLMGRGSKWVIYGKLSPELPCLSQTGQLIFMNKSIEGFWLVNWFMTTPKARQMDVVGDMLGLFGNGIWKTDVRAILSLDEAFEELPALLAEMNTGKILLRPQ